MIRYVKSALTATVLAASFASSQAYAILDFQGLYGFSKTASFSGGLDGDDASGTQMKFAAHINPLPLPMITLGVGLFFSTETYDVDGKQGMNAEVGGVTVLSAFDELTGYSLGPDIFFGVSIPGIDLMPYARVSYALAAITAKGNVSSVEGGDLVTEENVEQAMVGTGVHTSIGVSYSPLPLVSILAEYEFGTDTLEVPELTQGDLTTPKVEGEMASTSFLLGVEVGI